ncbi:MAG: Fe-S protein assembly co-chaperone HscB [Acidobacteria bacterium]|nr:Fe-S protein assembly co-chaperone HscB [Acidobacteriota bacterium]
MTAITKKGTVCWRCHAPHSGGHFCAACGKIQPLARGTDYFAFFGLPQKLWLDCAELEKLFHQLSWKLHPDNFVRAGEYERELSLERSSQLNDAYRALRDPVARVEYLLAHAGMRKEGAAKQQAPPELLEEVFELNESLDELRTARASSTDDSHLASLKQHLEAEERKLETKLREVDEELKRIATEWDAAFDAGADQSQRKALMSRMNDVLNRRSYIRNLVANVQKELAEA